VIYYVPGKQYSYPFAHGHKSFLKIIHSKFGNNRKLFTSLQRKTKICYANKYILKERIGLVPWATILVAERVVLLNKLKQRIRWNTGPARDCGVFYCNEINRRVALKKKLKDVLCKMINIESE